MKKVLKILVLILLLAFAGFQFYPRPEKNIASTPQTSDLMRVHYVPEPVAEVLVRSCYDCHSNSTNYPWYAGIQPLSLWLSDHIREGKKELNFSEFGTYSLRRQFRKLEEITEQVQDGEMPLESYTFIHRKSRLKSYHKQLIYSWVNGLRDSLQKNYPADSFVRRK